MNIIINHLRSRFIACILFQCTQLLIKTFNNNNNNCRSGHIPEVKRCKIAKAIKCGNFNLSFYVFLHPRVVKFIHCFNALLYGRSSKNEILSHYCVMVTESQLRPKHARLFNEFPSSDTGIETLILLWTPNAIFRFWCN